MEEKGNFEDSNTKILYTLGTNDDRAFQVWGGSENFEYGHFGKDYEKKL